MDKTVVAAAAIEETKNHYRSVIAAIDEFLRHLENMNKDEFVAHLHDEKRHFATKLAAV